MSEWRIISWEVGLLLQVAAGPARWVARMQASMQWKVMDSASNNRQYFMQAYLMLHFVHFVQLRSDPGFSALASTEILYGT